MMVESPYAPCMVKVISFSCINLSVILFKIEDSNLGSAELTGFLLFLPWDIMTVSEPSQIAADNK